MPRAAREEVEPNSDAPAPTDTTPRGDDGSVITEAELLSAVTAAFDLTGRGFDPWPDPHAGGAPHDDEYSRVTDPERWRIIGARADAWLAGLADLDLAAVERDVEVDWRSLTTVISRADRAVPPLAGALPLVVARSRIAEADDAGITLGVGDPALGVSWFPHCGCDACDSGSGDELDRLDQQILSIVTGRFRRLSQGDSEITVLREGSWSANLSVRRAVRVLADPTGWAEISGPTWLGDA